jgi:hypothetical protein
MADETGTKSYPEVTLGMELRDSEPFLGVIAIDAWEDGQRGPQWHMGIKPVDRVIQGPTGCLHNWANHSEKKRSKMGLLLQATLSVWNDKNLRIGHGDLLGRVAVFETQTINFGTNKETGEPIDVPLHIPVRAATAEEQARASGAGGPGGGTISTPASPEFTDDEVEQVLGVIEGLDKREMQKAVMRSQLSPELKNAILSDKVIGPLTERGLIEVDGEGKVQRLAGAAA